MRFETHRGRNVMITRILYTLFCSLCVVDPNGFITVVFLDLADENGFEVVLTLKQLLPNLQFMSIPILVLVK